MTNNMSGKITTANSFVLQEQVETLLRDQRDMKSKIDQLAAFSDLQSKSDEELRKQMYDAIDRVTVYCSRELDIWAA